jgi:hypothetical protein
MKDKYNIKRAYAGLVVTTEASFPAQTFFCDYLNCNCE